MADNAVLGLIPARGGSKGIENKNIVDVAGRPLISYAIEAMGASESIDRIVCTTDSEEIAEVAQEWGAEVPFLRPASMAEDDSPVYPALVHAVERVEELLDFVPEFVVTVQPTEPLVKSDHIESAVRKATTERAESTITAIELEHDAHPYNIRRKRPDGRVEFWMEEEHYDHPTRQSKPTFYKFGNVYVTRRDVLLERERLEGEDNYLVTIDAISGLDVNTPEDLDEVEYHLERRRGQTDG